VIRELKALGTTIFLVEQNLWLAEQVSDRHYIMENRRIVDCVGAAELGKQWNRVARHLGL
jgi:ABC-type branched-subunit amino acid transport system ATPase component